MSTRKMAALLAASLLGLAGSAVAGTTDAFTIASPIATTLSDPVTYSTPASGKKPPMQTYIGLQVGNPVTGLLMSNTSGNTVNGVSIRFTASVTDTEETLTLHQPEVYLPAGCTWDSLPANPKSFVCNFGQVKNGESIPAFRVFYVAPQKVCQPNGTNPCGGLGDALGSDVIDTQLQVLYSEGLNGPPTVWDNSNQSVSQAGLLTLGTFNPVKVKSAVPKSGAKAYTGSAGVPVPETLGGTNSQFAESLTVPALTVDAYTIAEMNIYKMTDAGAPTVTPGNIADCINGGRFVSCPVFATSVAQGVTETRFLDPANPLRIVYRVDATNLKLSAPKILNSTVILYTGKKFDPISNAVVGDWIDVPLQMCLVKDRVNSTDGLPCINGSRCYKKNDTGGIPDLEGDCEWELLNTANGYGKIQ